jgi:hypothetical protein
VQKKDFASAYTYAGLKNTRPGVVREVDPTAYTSSALNSFVSAIAWRTRVENFGRSQPRKSGRTSPLNLEGDRCISLLLEHSLGKVKLWVNIKDVESSSCCTC